MLIYVSRIVSSKLNLLFILASIAFKMKCTFLFMFLDKQSMFTFVSSPLLPWEEKVIELIRFCLNEQRYVKLLTYIYSLLFVKILNIGINDGINSLCKSEDSKDKWRLYVGKYQSKFTFSSKSNRSKDKQK